MARVSSKLGFKLNYKLKKRILEKEEDYEFRNGFWNFQEYLIILYIAL